MGFVTHRQVLPSFCLVTFRLVTFLAGTLLSFSAAPGQDVIGELRRAYFRS